MRRTLLPCILGFVLFCVSPSAWGNAVCTTACNGELACEVNAAQCLMANGDLDGAIEFVKKARQSKPQEAVLGRLLAAAYLQKQNPFWAERTLVELLDANPGDCETRSWLAWIFIQSGELELARETLAEQGCPEKPEDKARYAFLEMIMARTEEDTEKQAAAWAYLTSTRRVYPEDKDLWHHFWAEENPGWIDPIQLRADLSGGYTSDGQGDSPTDTASEGIQSAIGVFNIFTQFTAPFSKTIRPLVSAGLIGKGLSSKEVRKWSYLDFNIRPGILFGEQFPRLLIAYKGNLLRMNIPGKTWFYETHRAELEFEAPLGILVFAGAGRRIYRESGKTRTEFDFGIGGQLVSKRRFQLWATASVRRNFAEGEAYDLRGIKGVLLGRVNLGKGFLVKIGVRPGFDHYLHSGGARGQEAFATRKVRKDTRFNQFEELWSPPLGHVRFGLHYEYTIKDSTADSPTANYGYQEHRVLGLLSFVLNVNPRAPRSVSSVGGVPLNYGIGGDTKSAWDQERIQDLLRQDEAARSGSSCLN